MGFYDSFLPMPAELGGLPLDPSGMDMVRRQAISALGSSLLGANAIMDPGGAFGQGLLGALNVGQQGMTQQYGFANDQFERQRATERDALYRQQVEADAAYRQAQAQAAMQPQVDPVLQRSEFDLQRDMAWIDSLDIPEEQKLLLRIQRQLGKSLPREGPAGPPPRDSWEGYKRQWNYDNQDWDILGSTRAPEQTGQPDAPKPTYLTPSQINSGIQDVYQNMFNALPRQETFNGLPPERQAELAAQAEQAFYSRVNPEFLPPGAARDRALAAQGQSPSQAPGSQSPSGGDAVSRLRSLAAAAIAQGPAAAAAFRAQLQSQGATPEQLAALGL